MRIEVTAEDIANGKPGAVCDCPIALACRRAGLVEADVYPGGHEGGHVTFGHWGKRAKAPLAQEAVNFIHEFDNYRDVEPFAFDLAVTP